MAPAALRDAVLGALDEHVARRRPPRAALPPVPAVGGPDAVSVVAEVLARVGELARAGDLRCVRMDEAAAAVLG